jgi:glycosyltransferase involved in cell wall biosynthesis
VTTSVAFAIPGDINLQTGGYAYDRRVMALLPKFGVEVQHVQLPSGFPGPAEADLVETARLLGLVPAETAILADGLAYGAIPADLLRPLRSPIVALVHHPLCLEAGLTTQRQDELYVLERAALTLSRRVVVTSPTTRDTLARDFAVPADKVTVAEPGTDPAARAQGTGSPMQLLSVGSVVPRKAYDLLVQALAAVPGNWHLTIVGPTDRSPEALASLQTIIRETGAADRVDVAGPAGPEQLDRHYGAADLFVLPSLYEGYGMVLSEAMARGLPMICTTGGAAAATVPDTTAIKVPPGDVDALAAALRRVLDDASLRRRMGDAAWAAGQKLPRWEDTARIVAGVIKGLRS